jgi:hypothetical protein
MKTHELARALRVLADLLEAEPAFPIEQLTFARKGGKALNTGEMAVSLSTLVELSRVDKQQWISFIHELGFPLEIRPRDASRDILGKLLSYLEVDASARERLKSRASAKGSVASPELMKALSSLLRETK